MPRERIRGGIVAQGSALGATVGARVAGAADDHAGRRSTGCRAPGALRTGRARAGSGALSATLAATGSGRTLALTPAALRGVRGGRGSLGALAAATPTATAATAPAAGTAASWPWVRAARLRCALAPCERPPPCGCATTGSGLT